MLSVTLVLSKSMVLDVALTSCASDKINYFFELCFDDPLSHIDAPVSLANVTFAVLGWDCADYINPRFCAGTNFLYLRVDSECCLNCIFLLCGLYCSNLETLHEYFC